MSHQALTKEAYKLMHEGTIALSKMSYNGIKIDLDYAIKAKEQVLGEVADLERMMETKDIVKHWKKKYPYDFSYESLPQLRYIFYEVLKVPVSKFTAKGQAAMTKDVLDTIEHPLSDALMRRKGLLKMANTYLSNIITETNDDGFLRPDFNLTTTVTQRSSSSNPNFQNMPIRDKEKGKIIRSCFIPRGVDRHIVELDYCSLEVRIGVCYHKDKNMLEFIFTGGDMHKDSVLKCFLLKEHEMAKVLRNAVKGKFVFAEFYGSFFAQVAPDLWEFACSDEAITATGVPVQKHLADNGIIELGELNRSDYSVTPTIAGNTPEGCFYTHVKELERDLWENRFPGYDKWRKDFYNEYLQKGYFDNFTGFRFGGVYSKNQVTNTPVQSSAFHCNVWSFTRLMEAMEKYKMKGKLIDQIHDSIVGDIPTNELKQYIEMAEEITTDKLPKAWKWIITPLEIDADIAPAGESWYQKGKYKLS